MKRGVVSAREARIDGLARGCTPSGRMSFIHETDQLAVRSAAVQNEIALASSVLLECRRIVAQDVTCALQGSWLIGHSRRGIEVKTVPEGSGCGCAVMAVGGRAGDRGRADRRCRSACGCCGFGRSSMAGARGAVADRMAV